MASSAGLDTSKSVAQADVALDHQIAQRRGIAGLHRFARPQRTLVLRYHMPRPRPALLVKFIRSFLKFRRC